MRLLREVNDGMSRIIIFCETKRGCDRLCTDMRRHGVNALAIHGDKSQQERDWVLQQFREGKAPIMLATDVAARGLDVQGIKFVVNYDFPQNGIEDYIHRIGRTGRKTIKACPRRSLPPPAPARWLARFCLVGFRDRPGSATCRGSLRPVRATTRALLSRSSPPRTCGWPALLLTRSQLFPETPPPSRVAGGALGGPLDP